MLMRKIRKDLMNRRFNRLLVISRAEDIPASTMWKCLCDCGSTAVVRTNYLLSGHTRSCGCYRVDMHSQLFFKHGYALKSGVRIPEYYTWNNMKLRCYNPNSASYKYYGARGIIVCERWLHSFTNFLDDMGKRPTKAHSLDRINVNGNYEPSNCRWATLKEQRANRRIQAS